MKMNKKLIIVEYLYLRIYMEILMGYRGEEYTNCKYEKNQINIFTNLNIRFKYK